MERGEKKESTNQNVRVPGRGEAFDGAEGAINMKKTSQPMP